MDRINTDVSVPSHRTGKVALVAVIVLIAVAGTLAFLNHSTTPPAAAVAQDASPDSTRPAAAKTPSDEASSTLTRPVETSLVNEPDAEAPIVQAASQTQVPAVDRAGAPAEDSPSSDEFQLAQNSPASGLQTTGVEKQASSKSAVVPIVKDWPKPAFVLALTGQMHGYIEPCGCSPRQSGGLARRSDLFRQLREDKKWPVLAMETGGALNYERVTRHQSVLKFNMILDALNGMGYRGLGIGTEELQLTPIKLFSVYSERNVQEGFDLPFIAANVVLLGSTDLGTPQPYRVLKIGGKKVAVTSIFGNEYKKEVSLISKDELTITDPAEALPPVIAAMKKENPDAMVLMSYDSAETSRATTKKFPEFNVVVSAGGADDPGDEYEMVGDTLFFVSGMKGKHVNLIGFFPGDKTPIRFERVELDQDRFKRDPAIRKLMQEYQDRLKEEWLTPTSEVRAFTFPHESGHQFMGAKVCKECHASAYEVWEGSNHFNATASLLDGRPEEKGEWIDRTYDPECLCCHATGWDASGAIPYTDGFIDEKTTPHLLGNQCENCHGPGSEHVKLEKELKTKGGAPSATVTASRKAVHVSKANAEKKVCLKCHDFDNSPKFDFEKYWPDIAHPTPESEKSGK